MRYQHLILGLLLVFAIACQPEKVEKEEEKQDTYTCIDNNRFTEADFFTEGEIDYEYDINYGSAIDWLGNETELLFDVYYPRMELDSLALRPAIITIHGGGFQGGSKEGWRNECLEFAKKGFVAFTIKYRLGWNTSEPTDQLNAIYRANQDARAALRFIVANAEEYGVDPDLLFIGGSSAGAINSLNTVYTSQEDWNNFLPDIEDRLGSLNTSSNELTNSFKLNAVYNNWGAAFKPYVQAEEMVPMISFHGDMDQTVPVDSGENGLIGSRLLSQELQQNGICSDLTIEPGGGHGIYRDADGIAFRVGRASCFFKSVMCENCNDFYAEEKVEPDCSL